MCTIEQLLHLLTEYQRSSWRHWSPAPYLPARRSRETSERRHRRPALLRECSVQWPTQCALSIAKNPVKFPTTTTVIYAHVSLPRKAWQSELRRLHPPIMPHPLTSRSLSCRSLRSEDLALFLSFLCFFLESLSDLPLLRCRLDRGLWDLLLLSAFPERPPLGGASLSLVVLPPSKASAASKNAASVSNDKGSSET